MREPPFLSLLWKAILGCALILSATIALYTLYNVSSLNELEQSQRQEQQQQYVTEFVGLMARSAQQLSNIIDTLPQLESSETSLPQSINESWFALQLTWGLEGAELFDNEGKSIARWGDAWLQIDKQVLNQAKEYGKRSRSLSCLEQCYLNMVSPLLDANGQLFVMRVSASLADLILDFKNISNADIGFLVKANQPVTNDAHAWNVAALTNRERLEPLLHSQATNTPLPSSIATPRLRINREATAHGDTFDVLYLADSDLLGQRAMAVFISNISDAKRRIADSRNNYILLGLLVSFVSVMLIIAALWRPIMLLRNLSTTLPLLPEGKFDDAEHQLAQSPSWRLFSDELSELKANAIKVCRQLAGFRDHIESNNERLHELAHYDPLTGLINRTYLNTVIDQDYVSALDAGENFALLTLDLDNFKNINEGFGHEFGDDLLTLLSDRLKHCLGPDDCAARLGGDEFCLVVGHVDDREKLLRFIQRIQRALEEPFGFQQRTIPITFSIGAVVAPEHGSDASTLLQKADLALYRAKAEGKDTFEIFRNELLSDADARLALEAELRTAVSEQQFELHYQPQYALKDHSLLGFEALIRWQHPERGLLSPFFFIDALEKNGLIVPVGKWIIDHACSQLAAWHANGHSELTMSINLSVRQFSDPHLLDDIEASIQKYAIPASCLELEVTESLLATNISHATELLTMLQKLGCKIAIDDFGTGYSSLAYLKQLPLDKLKVDRTFVKDIPSDQDDMQICSAIVAMAHSLGLRVVAEGIETQEQEDFLRSINCETGQGFLFSKPVSADFASTQYHLDQDHLDQATPSQQKASGKK